MPELSERDREMANNNSMFNRGDNTVNSYKQYADEINGWDISLKQKEKLISQLKKKFDERLSIDARYVPWTVSGPAGYNSKKMGGLADRAMRTSAEISDWFDKVKENVKRSTKKTDDRGENARRKEAWFHRALQSGWYNRDGKPSPTLVASGLADIAPYDPKRFADLYEKYDKQLHFRKNTNAAKLYEMVKKGEYTGLKEPKKLYESDSYNVYQKNIKAGERVFLNFPVQPKPQMIWALKMIWKMRGASPWISMTRNSSRESRRTTKNTYEAAELNRLAETQSRGKTHESKGVAGGNAEKAAGISQCK